MSQPARPPMVTSACLFLGLSCLLLLWYVSGWLTSWNSLDVQEGLRGALNPDDLGRIGLSANGLIDGLHTALLVLVVVLVAGVVFAVYAARGHLQSRIMLCIVAGVAALSFVAGGQLIGLIPAAFVAVSISQLWSADARRWYAQVNGRPVPAAAQQDGPDPFATRDTAPPPTPGPAAPPSGSAPVQTWAPPSASPHVTSTLTAPPTQAGPPSTVRTIVLITSISTGIAAFFAALYLLVYFTSREALVQAQQDSPFESMVTSSEDEIREAMRLAATTCLISLVLAAAATVAVIALMRGQRGGQFGLVVLSGVTIFMGLISLAGLPWAGAAVWVLVLLRRPDVKRWVDPARKASGP